MLRRVLRSTGEFLRRAGISSVLAVLGVAIGAANIIALISVTDTARHQTLGILREMGMDTVFVLPFSDEDEGMFMQANANAFLPEGFLQVVEQVPEVDLAAGVLMMPGHIGAGGERKFTLIEGASPDYTEVRGHAVETGRFITPEDEQLKARVACLGHGMGEELFGDQPLLGQTIVIKGERFEVVGLMIEKGMVGFQSMDDRVFIPLSTAKEIYSLGGMHSILARAADGVEAVVAKASVLAALRSYLGSEEGEPEVFSVSTVDDLTGVFETTMGIFRLLMYGVSSVALLVAGIGIMNVMLMQVIERTREIGVRRAIGARRRDIWLQFLWEAVFQAVVGAACGILLGVAGALVFCNIVDWQFYMAASTVLLALAVSIGTGVVFGVYPAIQAARLKPIDCLRYE